MQHPSRNRPNFFGISRDSLDMQYQGSHSSCSDRAAPASAVNSTRALNGVDMCGKAFARPISFFENTEISGLHLAAGEDNELDDEDVTSRIASTSSASVYEKQSSHIDPLLTPENLLLIESDSVKPMVPKALDSETVHSKTPSFYKARKTRTKLRMHKPFVIGVRLKESSMHALYPSGSKDIDIETKDWLLSTKRKAPQSVFEGTKRPPVKGKPLQLTGKIDTELDALKMRKTCQDVDLDGNNMSDLLNSDVFEDNNVLGDNREHCMHSTSDASKEGFGKQYGDIKDEEKDREETGLCGQQTHFLAWFAGLIIRALQFEFKFMSHLFITLLLALYHSLFNPMRYMLKAKVRAIEAHRKENNDMAMLGPRMKERVFSIQPTIVKVARRLVFGCSTAFYTIMMLTLLFVASLMLSYFVVKGFVYEPIQLYEDLYFDYTKPLPVASVDFAFSKVYPDTGSIMRRIACPTRKFHVTVFFTMPESDFNKELGIFQVTTELLSVRGQVLLSRTQPCMLRFRSTALQRAKSLLMAIPLLTGFYSETQTSAVSLLEWQERRALSFAAVRVMLAPRAGRPLAMGLPQLYKAEIHVNSELPWWVSIIGHWRWTISVWIGLSLFIVVVVFILFLCNQILIPDLGLVLSYGLGEFHKGRAACLKHEQLVSKSASDTMHLGSKNAEINGTLCTCK